MQVQQEQIRLSNNCLIKNEDKMFKKKIENYNYKIEYKMLYFLNPKLDTINNYYEVLDIYKNNSSYTSEQGKWFKKIKNVYDYLLKNELNIENILYYSALEFETSVNYVIKQKIIEKYLKLSIKDITFVATWLLKRFIGDKPLAENSDVLGILIFNAIIKKHDYIPIIFTKDYIMFLKQVINKKISTSSLKDILSIYEDLSIKYNKRYKKISKEDLIKIIKGSKEYLINNFDIKKVWLYGSFVRGEETEYSDIDLYVEFSKDKTEYEIEQVQNYFVLILGRSVDMLIEHRIYKNISNNAIKEREIIFDDCK